MGRLLISKGNINLAVFVLILLVVSFEGISQDVEQKILISDMKIQIETTEAVNNLYNFKFDKAEMQFRWLLQKYDWHPLPYFLLGLSEWWKILPEREAEDHDEIFLAKMDKVIEVAKKLYERPEYRIEAAFFLSAGYGFKGRLLSERKKWRKSAVAGKNALKYLSISKGHHALSTELLFGDALYNYYAEWIPEHYPLLKPILWFFPNGDKELGIKQLREVSLNAFYTRVEAQLFLMEILFREGRNTNRPQLKEDALQISQYMNETFPDNAYFHRTYARMLYGMGKLHKAEEISLEVLAKVDSLMTGYNAKTGKYVSFFLGQTHEAKRDFDSAKHYYKRAIEFGEMEDGRETSYYLYSLLHLGIIADQKDDQTAFEGYIKQIKKYSKRKDPVQKELSRYLEARDGKT